MAVAVIYYNVPHTMYNVQCRALVARTTGRIHVLTAQVGRVGFTGMAGLGGGVVWGMGRTGAAGMCNGWVVVLYVV